MVFNNRSLRIALLALLVLLFAAQCSFGQTRSILPFSRLADFGVKYSPECGIYEKDITVTFQTPPDMRLEYATGFSDPPVFQPYTTPIPIHENTTFRVRLKGDSVTSKLFAGSFYVGRKYNFPIVSILVKPDEFFPPNGIYEGHMVNTSSGTELVGNCWKKIPIPCFVEFMFRQKCVEATSCLIKTFGGMTLGFNEKSLHLIAEDSLGARKFRYKFFRRLPYNEFRHLVLRTSGNDQNQTRFKDMSCSSFAMEMGIDHMAYQPTIMYVNGEYFGIVNLREKVNKDYLSYHHHALKDSTILVQGSGQREPSFMEVFQFVQDNYTSPTFLEDLDSKIDLESYLNWSILQIYIANTDSRGNVRFWKDKSQDNKWRWIFYDSDLGCNPNFHSINFLNKRISPRSTDWYNPGYTTHLLRHITYNEDTKNRFINQACLLMNTILHRDSTLHRIDQFTQWLEPEMPYHVLRYPIRRKGSVEAWQTHVKNYRAFWESRPESMMAHYKETFSLGETVDVDVTTNFPDQPLLEFNHSKIKFTGVKGPFFSGRTLPVKAKDNAFPYLFKKWDDNPELGPERELDLSTDVQVRAKYVHAPIDTTFKMIQIRRFGSEMKNKAVELHWMEIINASHDSIAMTGCAVYRYPMGKVVTLPDMRFNPKSSLIIASDTGAWHQLHPEYKGTLIQAQVLDQFESKINLYLGRNDAFVLDSAWIQFPDTLLCYGDAFVAERIDQKWSYRRTGAVEDPIAWEVVVPEHPAIALARKWWAQYKIIIISGASALLLIIICIPILILRRRKKRNNKVNPPDVQETASN